MKYFKSKKLIAAILGVFIVLLGEYGIDIPADVVDQVVNLIMIYVVGQSAVDVGLVVKGKKD